MSEEKKDPLLGADGAGEDGSEGTKPKAQAKPAAKGALKDLPPEISDLITRQGALIESQGAAIEDLRRQVSQKAPGVPAGKTGLETEKAMIGDAAKMKKILDAQPQVMFYIPLAPGEKKGAVEPVEINFYRILVPKGIMTKLPQQVVEILAEHYRVDSEAGEEFRIGSPKHRQGAEASEESLQ